MKVLIVGNMGYIGPVVLRHLRKGYLQAILIGFDTRFFAQCLYGARTVFRVFA